MTNLEAAILALARLRAATRRGLASAECQRADTIAALRQLEFTSIPVRARLLLRCLEHGGMVDVIWTGAVIEDLEPLLLDEAPSSSDTTPSPPSDEMAVVYDISLEEATQDDTVPREVRSDSMSPEAREFYASLIAAEAS